MSAREHAAWALARFTAGSLMALLHGYPKVFEGKMAGLVGSVARMGLPFPTFFAWAASLTELVGGILLALGLATRPAAAFLCLNMLVALYHHAGDPFVRSEKALLYLAFALLALIVGGGRYSLDSVVRLRSPLAQRRGSLIS